MKTINITIILLSSFLFSNAQSYEIETVKRDTINMTDANGKKNGKWFIMGRNKPGSGYQPEQKIEEGIYKDNKKIGVWTEYYKNNKIKSKINFVDGKPHGLTSSYYENGNLKEEGTWINNRWNGKYKFIWENGDAMEIVFDDKGKEISKKMLLAKNSVPSTKK